MTTEPQTKKYRRKVSDERVEKAAHAINQMYNDGCELCYIMEARAALEADAEVIEAEIKVSEVLKSVTVILSRHGLCGFYGYYDTLEQFNAEWEEITE